MALAAESLAALTQVLHVGFAQSARLLTPAEIYGLFTVAVSTGGEVDETLLDRLLIYVNQQATDELAKSKKHAERGKFFRNDLVLPGLSLKEWLRDVRLSRLGYSMAPLPPYEPKPVVAELVARIGSPLSDFRFPQILCILQVTGRRRRRKKGV